MRERTPSPEVRPRQVWADNDPRSVGRQLRVVAVADGKAVCQVISDSTEAKVSQVGKTRRIAVERFRPTTSGYRLVIDEWGNRVGEASTDLTPP